MIFLIDYEVVKDAAHCQCVQFSTEGTDTPLRKSMTWHT